MFILIRMLTFFFDQGTPKSSQSQWQRKKRWFAAAVAIFLLSSLIFTFKSYSLKANIASDDTERQLAQIESARTKITKKSKGKKEHETAIQAVQTKIDDHAQYYQPRDLQMQLLRALTV